MCDYESYLVVPVIKATVGDVCQCAGLGGRPQQLNQTARQSPVVR